MRASWISAGALVLSALSLIGVNYAVASGPDGTVTGCAIRFYPSGPVVHTNRTHECPYVTGVRVHPGGDLVIERDHGSVIQSVTVSPDETLTARGIIAGASGGGNRTRVRFHDTRAGKPVRADDSALRGPRANVWITWVS